VRDDMRDSPKFFMCARNFSGAPGKIGWSFFVYRGRVNASHLVLSLLLLRFRDRCFWFVIFYFCVAQHVKALEQEPCHVRNEKKNMREK
jgi:hypothetical protein